jgi:asparagine synthase (glutamine-hydrolysing)
LGALLRAIPAGQWDRILQAVSWKGRPARSGEKVHRVARMLDARTADEFYQMVMTQREAQSGLVLAAKGSMGLGLDRGLAAVLPDFVERMQYFDTMTYLAEDIMAKVDRTTMAVSLEAREPLLDHRLVEFAWTLPKQYKFANGQGKWLLRQVLFRYVPLELVERPKMGFSIPIDEWLRGVLREWAEDLLDEQRLQADGLLASSIVRRLWSEHQARIHNHSTILWNLLMLQAWRRYNQV